jgi:hypothetical protein
MGVTFRFCSVRFPKRALFANSNQAWGGHQPPHFFSSRSIAAQLAVESTRFIREGFQ